MEMAEYRLHEDIREILRLQYEQTKELASIKSYQITHSKRIDDLEKEQKVNSNYRAKMVGIVGIIYIIVGIFGGVLAKKL
jgi:hypothetical protein